MNDYAARVRLGALLLDEARPGWADEIDSARLRMDSSERDVLGQLWGDFRAGFRAAIAHRSAAVLHSAAAHGFTLFGDEQDTLHDPIGTSLRFQALTDAWRELLRARR